jgi:hypothetical protein
MNNSIMNSLCNKTGQLSRKIPFKWLIDNQISNRHFLWASFNLPSQPTIQDAEELLPAGSKEFPETKNVFADQYPGPYYWHYLLHADIPFYPE